MTSYFEIGGHIVQCETTLQSPLSGGTTRSQFRIPDSFDVRAAYAERPVELASPSVSTSTPSKSNQIKRMIGSTMIRTGVAILLVPDPIPVIDEVLGAGLVYGGAYVMSTAD